MRHVYTLNEFVEKANEVNSMQGIPEGREDLLSMGTQLLRELKHVSAALDAIGSYNSFNPDEVFEILTDEWYRIGQVSVGYENSPVVYVWMKDDAPEAFFHSAYVKLIGAAADEVDYVMGRSLIRAWWD